MKLTTALLASLMGISSFVAAENVSENINVNVNIENDEGKIIIIKDINGETQTIKKTFAAGSDVDIEAMVDAILAENGIDHQGKTMHKEVIKLVNEGGNDFTWIQKNDNVDVDITNGKATVMIMKDNNGKIEVIEEFFDVDSQSDINVLIDELMAEHGIEPGDAKVHKKIIKLDKKIVHIDDNKPRMGFMANVKDNGWQVMSVVSDSGAAEAGMQKGDVVISIDGQSTKKGGLGMIEFITMDHKAGQASQVLVLRDNKELTLNVTAKVIDSPDIVMALDGKHKWFSSSGNDFQFKTGDLDNMFEGLHVDVDHLEKMVEGLGNHEIHVVTTTDANAYFFADSKLNQWLGKNHHFSSITESLGQYFGTTVGVLVLEVDKDNKLGLKDGDVIQAINGQAVNSPKEVIKIMSGFNADESFEIEIIRKKETLYLES